MENNHLIDNQAKKKPGNPMWVAGGNSPNPEGARARNKHSARTTKGMIERFLKRNMTPRKLQSLYDGLTALQKIELLGQLLPYVLPKQSPEAIGEAEVELLYQKLEQTLKSNVEQRKAG
jgi:hypothetical protein